MLVPNSVGLIDGRSTTFSSGDGQRRNYNAGVLDNSVLLCETRLPLPQIQCSCFQWSLSASITIDFHSMLNSVAGESVCTHAGQHDRILHHSNERSVRVQILTCSLLGHTASTCFKKSRSNE